MHATRAPPAQDMPAFAQSVEESSVGTDDCEAVEFCAGLHALLPEAAGQFSQPLWCCAGWSQQQREGLLDLLTGVRGANVDNDMRAAVTTICADIVAVAPLLGVDAAPFCLVIEQPDLTGRSAVTEAFNRTCGTDHYIFVCVGAFLQLGRLAAPERERRAWLLGTLAHELTHNVHRGHGTAFINALTMTLASTALCSPAGPMAYGDTHSPGPADPRRKRGQVHGEPGSDGNARTARKSRRK
jgi:hypothetical protein